MRNLSLTAPVLLCLIGLLLSFEYRGEKYHTLLWVFRGLSVAVAAAGALGWIIAMPQWALYTINIASVAVNLPLAVIGLKKGK